MAWDLHTAVFEGRLCEYEFTSTFMGPDYSGARGGYDMPPFETDDDFPYAHDATYGEPSEWTVGQGRGVGFGSSHEPLTPMDVSHSAWDDVSEASGTPYLLGKDGQGGRNGGTTVPGGSGGWSSMPPRPWDSSGGDGVSLSSWDPGLSDPDDEGLDLSLSDGAPSEFSLLSVRDFFR